MDYTTTHKQHEDRRTLRDHLADAINFANLVRQQPNLTAAQRESIQWAQVAMLRAKRELQPKLMPEPNSVCDPFAFCMES